MSLPDLQLQIKKKELNSMYIFLGEEIAIQKIYINKMAEISNLEVQYVEEFKTIYNKLSNNDIFNTKKLYVILDDVEFTKQEKIWALLNTESINGNIIIFKYNNLDKRGKFYKYYQTNLIEFNKLSNEVLMQYIKKDLPALNDDNCNKLINICNSSYNQILLEIDKVKMYMNYPYTTPFNNEVNDVFIKLEKEGAFHKEISDIAFDFIDKVLRRDIKAVYELRKNLIKIGESNIKILSLLYNNIKTVLLIQSCQSSDICKTTGLQYYQVKYNKDKVNIYTTGELVVALKLIQEIEEGIKTGQIEEQISLDYLLVNIL